MLKPVDPLLWNDWHVVADGEWLKGRGRLPTKLFDCNILVSHRSAGGFGVADAATGKALPCETRHGFVWTCLGRPEREIIAVPEADEADRLVTTGGSIAVQTSGPRAIENFLDMGHLPFVHTGSLGEEPHTEVAEYDVEMTEGGGIHATNCRFYQPATSPSAQGGMIAHYRYRVLRAYSAALFKTNPVDPSREDAIYLFIQPTTEESCVAHLCLVHLEKDRTPALLRWFAQYIFAQDKPILESQRPKRLPLDPRAETPIRADKSSVAYRRWLAAEGLTYGVIGPRA